MKKSVIYIIFMLFICFIIPFLLIPFFIIFNKSADILLDNYLGFIINNILQVNNIKINDRKIIDKGYIIANHCSVYDIFHDVYYTKSVPVADWKILYKLPFTLSLIILCNRIFIFNRDKKNIDRSKLFSNIKSKLNNIKNKEYSRILFYPEGKLFKYDKLESVDELQGYLKFGLLKKIYEDQLYPVQIYITSYKTKVINEVKYIINFKKNIYSKLSLPIYPSNFSTFEEFRDYICKKWFKYYQQTNL
jgi:hypothetical protein